MTPSFADLLHGSAASPILFVAVAEMVPTWSDLLGPWFVLPSSAG
jgi:hypothetical protein